MINTVRQSRVIVHHSISDVYIHKATCVVTYMHGVNSILVYFMKVQEGYKVT